MQCDAAGEEARTVALKIVFDLTARPEQIQPALGFYAVFLLGGVVLLGTVLLLRPRKLPALRGLLPFSVVLLGFSGFMAWRDRQDTLRIRQMVRQGQYATVEGCLDYFRPGLPDSTKSTASDERWSVRGVEFDYGHGRVAPGYKLVEPRGGHVHARSTVQVSFVMSEFYGRREIVRLAVAQDACPAAGHPPER